MEAENTPKISLSLKTIAVSTITILVLVITSSAVASYITAKVLRGTTQGPLSTKAAQSLQEKVVPTKGVTLPVKWGDLGAKMLEAGVIDRSKMEELYKQRGGLSGDDKKLLTDKNNGNITINLQNSGYILNLFWALGLVNKNTVLETGPMSDQRYGGAANFASTGGWSLGQADAMQYYSKAPLITLTPDQQAMVERVAKNIYRPCCNNSTFFPDCNHGMAMLGFLELAASQGLSEKELYQGALILNSYWFPDTYLVLAQYMASQGKPWTKVDPQEVLGAQYSSASGYGKIRAAVAPVQQQSGGGGCGA